MRIRDAQLVDITAITDIYNHAVQYTTAIWNETVVSIENREAWFSLKISQGFPVLVAEDEESGQILGYASFGHWRDFDGYRHTVEHSVYVHPEQHKKGIGARLLGGLIERARQQDKHVMVAGIEANNIASIKLHEKFGFAFVGTFKEAGTKFGKWLDLTFLELHL